MAGIDFLGGKPGNYILGRGKLYFQGEFAGQPLAWRDIGNATAFTVSQEAELKEHQSFLSGIKTIDLEVAVSSKLNLAFTIDEVANFLNLAPALLGDVQGYNMDILTPINSLGNSAACASDNITDAAWGGNGPVLVGTENFYVAVGAGRYGVWMDMQLVYAQGFGTHRGYNFDSTQTFTVWYNPDTRTTLGAGTDWTSFDGTKWEIDKATGRIRILDVTYNHTTDDLIVKWGAPGVDRHPVGALPGQDSELERIRPLISSGLTVALKFVQENANDSSAQPIEYEFFKVKLTPDGDIAAIGDDWATLSFTGAAASIANPPTGASVYGRITGRRSVVA